MEVSKPNKRENAMTVPLDKMLIARIDAFLETPTARKLHMKSRPDFLSRLAIAFLSKHDKQYQELLKLFDISDQELRDIRRASTE